METQAKITKTEKRRVYLDNAATTCVSDTAFEAMKPFLRGSFGNPSALYAEALRLSGLARKSHRSLAPRRMKSISRRVVLNRIIGP